MTSTFNGTCRAIAAAAAILVFAAGFAQTAQAQSEDELCIKQCQAKCQAETTADDTAALKECLQQCVKDECAPSAQKLLTSRFFY